MILMQNFTYAMQNLNMYDTKHETKTKYLTYITRKMKPPTKMDGKPQAPPADEQKWLGPKVLSGYLLVGDGFRHESSLYLPCQHDPLKNDISHLYA